MNKKHGLVATAWMLGGGLLLNASMVQAQTGTPADEYYAPYQSAPFLPKKAPRLLPETIRNADGSASNSIARPISPNGSLSAGHKINGTAAAPKRSTNRVTITPANHQDESTFQPANQSEASPSPVQKQLEEMYRKDGRPMPQMNFSQTPLPTNAQNPSVVSPPNAGPSNVVPSKPRSILSKLNPFSRNKGAPAQLPNHPANPIPNTALRPPQVPPATNGINPAGGNRATGFNNGAPRALPVPASAIPASQNQAGQSAAQNGSQLPNALPPVPGDPGYRAPAPSTTDAITIPPAPASVDDALEDAFKDMTEEGSEAATEAEAAPSKPADPMATEEGNPFSGLSLDDEFGPATKPATTDSSKDKPRSESEATAADDQIPVPPEPIAPEPAKEEIDAKMKLITERAELRGLKGFCPVTLRDDRDLKNALPEHHSTFKGRTYYFSTDEAKTTFEERPEHYAPISGGQDVVLLKEKVTKEGSLDHAVWFKDRLYFFTSQKTLEQFVATPKEFAISE